MVTFTTKAGTGFIARDRFETLHGVALARSNDSTYPAMTALHVEDKWIAASDGRRLHYCRNHYDLVAGEYTVTQCTRTAVTVEPRTADEIEKTGSFPNWRRVLPHKIASAFSINFSKDSRTAISDIIAILRRTPINPDYLKDLPLTNYRVYLQPDRISSNGTPIPQAALFRNRDLRAVIMPMQIASAPAGNRVYEPKDRSIVGRVIA